MFWPSRHAWPSPLSDSWMSQVRKPFCSWPPKLPPMGCNHLFIGFGDTSHLPSWLFEIPQLSVNPHSGRKIFPSKHPRLSPWAPDHFVFISRCPLYSSLTSPWFQLQEVRTIPYTVESQSVIYHMIYLWSIQYHLLGQVLAFSVKLGCFVFGPLWTLWPLHFEGKPPRASSLELTFWCPETRPHLPSPLHWSFPCLEVPISAMKPNKICSRGPFPSLKPSYTLRSKQ